MAEAAIKRGSSTAQPKTPMKNKTTPNSLSSPQRLAGLTLMIAVASTGLVLGDVIIIRPQPNPPQTAAPITPQISNPKMNVPPVADRQPNTPQLTTPQMNTPSIKQPLPVTPQITTRPLNTPPVPGQNASVPQGHSQPIKP